MLGGFCQIVTAALIPYCLFTSTIYRHYSCYPISVAIVKLQNPRLLLSCDGENIGSHCPEKVVTTYCDATGKTKCEYLQIPYKIVSNPEVIV
jgi:hypothetical protein